MDLHSDFGAICSSEASDCHLIHSEMRGGQELLDTLESSKDASSSSPIQNLPPELLAEIFHNVSSSSAACSSVIRICLVCRYWHAVALANTNLWTSISFRNVAHAKAFLRRSQSSPIRVYLDRRRMPDDTATILAPHIHRVQSLHISLRHPDQLETLLAGLSRPAPRLEELVLHIGRLQNGWSYDWHFNDLVFTRPSSTVFASLPFQGHTPMLRSLTLSCVCLDWTAGIFKNLIDLAIIDAPPSLSVVLLLDILSACPALDKLLLRFVHNVRPDLLEVPPTRRHTPLCHLSRFHLESSHLRYVAHLFAHLSIPISARISIITLSYMRVWNLFPMILHNSTALPQLTRFRRLEIGIVPIPHSLLKRMLLRTYQDTGVDPLLDIPHFQLAAMVWKFEQNIYHLWSGLDLSGVELFVAGGDSSECKGFWTHILHPMYNLRTLKLFRLPSLSLIVVLEVLEDAHFLDDPRTGLLCAQMANLEVVAAHGTGRRLLVWNSRR